MSTNQNNKMQISIISIIVAILLIGYGVFSAILPFLDLTPMSFADETALTESYGASWYFLYLMSPDYFK